jgi:hypothetical protein
MLESGKRYFGIVTSGQFIYSQKGIPAYQVFIDCPDEMISTSYTIWMSPNSDQKRLEKDFATIGLSLAQVSDAKKYTEEQLNEIIAHKEIVFGVKENEFKGKTTLQVKWIERKGAIPTKPPREAAAEFFGGKSAAKMDDDEPPF